jgi:excisionase family DNA binding protein
MPRSIATLNMEIARVVKENRALKGRTARISDQLYRKNEIYRCKLLTPKEVAEYLSVSSATISRMAKTGELPVTILKKGIKGSLLWRMRWDSLEQYLKENTVERKKNLTIKAMIRKGEKGKWLKQQKQKLLLVKQLIQN